MAITNLVTSIIKSGTYPVEKSVSAPNNCGTVSLIATDWTTQMIYELPTINIAVLSNNVKLMSVDIDMTTFMTKNRQCEPVIPYTLPLYNLPSSFKFVITPLFDRYALQNHNEQIELGNIEVFETSQRGIVNTNTSSYNSLLWTVPTQSFDIAIMFNNDNIKAGGGSGGGGGGGATTAYDVSYDNTGTTLQASNVQDALTELSNRAASSVIITKTLLKNSWSSAQYTITDANILAASTIYISIPTNITQAQYNAIALANIVPRAQQNGSIVLEALGTVPTVDIPIQLTISNAS